MKKKRTEPVHRYKSEKDQVMGVKGKYRILQALFWMNTVIVWGYGIAYLKEYGFSAGELGILFAVVSLLAAVLQPVFGRIADTSKRFHWKVLLVGLTGLLFLLMISLLIIRNNVVIALVIGAFSMILNITLGMMNSVCFYYEHRGTDMNFGVARGLGSLAYAGLSFLLGQLIAGSGMKVVLYAGIIVSLCIFLMSFTFPYYGPLENTAEKTVAKEKRSVISFLKQYPAFFLMVGACALFLTFQIMTSSYMVMIVESVGGDSKSLGVVLSLAALLEIPVMFLTGRLVKRFRSYWLITLAGAIYALRGVLYFLASDVISVYLIQLLQPISYALVVSVQVYFTDECMEERDLATGQTFMGTSQAIGSTLGYLLGGLVIEKAGMGSMLLFAAGMGAAGTVIAIISSFMRRNAEKLKAFK